MDDSSFAMQRQQPDQMVQWCSPAIDSQHFGPGHFQAPPRLPPTPREDTYQSNPPRIDSHVPFGGQTLPPLSLSQYPLTQQHRYLTSRPSANIPSNLYQPQRFTSTDYSPLMGNMHTRATPQGFPPASQPIEHAAARRASHPLSLPAPKPPPQHNMHMRASMSDVPTDSAFAWGLHHHHQYPTEAVSRPFTAQHVSYSGASLPANSQAALPTQTNLAHAHANTSDIPATNPEKVVDSTESLDRPSTNHSSEEIVVSSQKTTDTVQPSTTEAIPAPMPGTTNSSDKENSIPIEVSRKKSSSASASQASVSAAGSMMAEGVKSRKRSQVTRFGQESAAATPPPPTKTQKTSAPAKQALKRGTSHNDLIPEGQSSQHPKAIESRIYRAAKSEGWSKEETSAKLAAARAAARLGNPGTSKTKPARAKKSQTVAGEAVNSVAAATSASAEQSAGQDVTLAIGGGSEQAAENVSTISTKRTAEDDTAVRRSSKRLRTTPIHIAPTRQQSSSETIGHIPQATAADGAEAEVDTANDTITPVSRLAPRPGGSVDAEQDGSEGIPCRADQETHTNGGRDLEHATHTQDGPADPDATVTTTLSSTPVRRSSVRPATRRRNRTPAWTLTQTSLDADDLQFLRNVARNGENLNWTDMEDYELRRSTFRKAVNRRTAANRTGSQVADATPALPVNELSRAAAVVDGVNAVSHDSGASAGPSMGLADSIERNASDSVDEPASSQPEAGVDHVDTIEPSSASAPRFAQSLLDIQKYSLPNENLDWTKEEDKVKRTQKQRIITRRKQKDPDRQPTYGGRRSSGTDVLQSGDPTFSSVAAPTSTSARSTRLKGRRSYVDNSEILKESDVDGEEESPAPQVQELKTGKIEFTDGTFADTDFVDSLKLVLASKARTSGFPGKQAKRIENLLNVAEPPRTGEALWLVTAEQAAKWLAPNQYFDGPIVVHGQQSLPLQSIDDFLGEHFDDSVAVSIQDPSTHNNPHVRDVTMGQIKSRFSQPVKGNPWNLLELATHRDDGIRPAFLNSLECSLLTKVKLPESGDTASRRGFTAGWKEVEKWTLVAQAGALTEPHQDSHGYSTYITINQGVVGFGWLSKPTAEERREWCKDHAGYVGGRWRYVILRPGMTIYFPAGTVHFVFRHPEAGNTLAFGGHVLRCSQIVRWIDVLLQETAIPSVTNEDLSLSAPGYLKAVERYVKQALKTGQVEAWGGNGSIESFLEKKKEFEKLQVVIEKKRRAEEKKRLS